MINEREQLILQMLSKSGRVLTTELSEEFGVSTVTIRNDLNRMHDAGLLIKNHGGAVLATENSNFRTNFQFRETQNYAKKAAIAEMALELINDGETIMLDASSTCLLLAQKLSGFKRLTVVTNGIYTMLTLKDLPNITTIMIGGIVTKNSGSTEGTLGAKMLENFIVDKAFFSSHSISEESGLSDFNFYEVELKELMLKRARKIVALIDSTKFDRGSVATFATLSQVNTILSDKGLSEQNKLIYSNLVDELILC